MTRQTAWLTLVLLALTPPGLAQAPPVPAPDAPARPPAAANAVELARKAVAEGNLPNALEALQGLAKDDPTSAPPRVTLAAILVQANQGSQARLQLEQAARDDPKHPDVHLLNAQFAFGEGRTTEGILSAQAALQYAAETRWEPAQRERFLRQGRIALASGLELRQDYAGAQEPLRALLAKEPNNGVARARLATALFFQGQTDAAHAELQAAAQSDPTLTQPELRMADLFAQKGEAAKADEWRRKAIALKPNDFRPHRAMAAALLDQGKYNDASLYIDSGTKLDPTGKELLPLKGFWHRYRKEHAQAEAVFDRLYRDSPGNAVFAWNLAIALAESGDAERQRRAVEIADGEARKNPRSSEAFAVLGWCHLKAGQRDQAERALVQATQIGPLGADAGYFLARLLADRKRYADAAAALQGALGVSGAFVYREQATALLEEVMTQLPKTPAKP